MPLNPIFQNNLNGLKSGYYLLPNTEFHFDAFATGFEFYSNDAGLIEISVRKLAIIFCIPVEIIIIDTDTYYFNYRRRLVLPSHVQPS